jgi:hypothetical protein
MAELKTFIAENAHTGFDIIAKLDTVHDLIDVRKFERYYEAPIKAFEDGAKADAVYNTVHVEAKDAVNRIFDTAWEKVDYAAPWFGYQQPNQKVLNDADIYPEHHINGTNYKKAIRTLDAMEKVLNDAESKAAIAQLRRLGDAYSYCMDAFKATQSKVIKGRRPNLNAANEFASRMGSAHAVATVRTNLLKSITPPLDDFEKQVQAWFERVLAGLDAACKGQTEVKPFKNPIDSMVFNKTYDFKAKGWDDKRVYTELKRTANADAFPKHEAAIQRKIIEEKFLHKNALKLSALLDAKGNLTSIDVLPSSPVKLHNGAGTLTSEMVVKFADGSSFTVRNKVIINRTSLGNTFYQFPTTFHDVVKADGTKLDAPSEEKMLKVFGGKA